MNDGPHIYMPDVDDFGDLVAEACEYNNKRHFSHTVCEAPLDDKPSCQKTAYCPLRWMEDEDGDADVVPFSLFVTMTDKLRRWIRDEATAVVCERLYLECVIFEEHVAVFCSHNTIISSRRIAHVSRASFLRVASGVVTN